MKNGGPAFPNGIITDSDGKIISNMGGMTFLDYFAGQALAGLASMSIYIGDRTKEAYSLAEAMLAEKKRREKGE